MKISSASQDDEYNLMDFMRSVLPWLQNYTKILWQNKVYTISSYEYSHTNLQHLHQIVSSHQFIMAICGLSEEYKAGLMSRIGWCDSWYWQWEQPYDDFKKKCLIKLNAPSQ